MKGTPVAGGTRPAARPDIQTKSYQFALRILKVVRALPRDAGGQVIARQIARSGTSVGANVEEAQGSQTKREFARRMSIARSEALETRYWLRLTADAGLIPRRRLELLIEEADELVRVLVTIVKRARGG
jgi:four helix bundle protein